MGNCSNKPALCESSKKTILPMNGLMLKGMGARPSRMGEDKADTYRVFHVEDRGCGEGSVLDPLAQIRDLRVLDFKIGGENAHSLHSLTSKIKEVF